MLGHRGYDAGAAIANELYGPHPDASSPLRRRYPSLPEDQQGSAEAGTPLGSSFTHMFSAIAVGLTIGVVWGIVQGRRGGGAPGAPRRPQPLRGARTLAAVRAANASAPPPQA